MKKRSVSIRGHRTSYSIEDDFWIALKTMADEDGKSVARLVTEIDAARDPGENLSSSIRLYVFRRTTATITGPRHKSND